MEISKRSMCIPSRPLVPSMVRAFAMSSFCRAVRCAASSATTQIPGRSAKRRQHDAKDVLQRALRYRSYWRGGGGITVSGGEPLLQIDFLLELFEEAKKQGIHTVIDTCGQPFTREEPFFSKFKALMDKHRPGAARHQAHRQRTASNADRLGQ